MLKKDFYFDLPKGQIAQHPAEPRDSARLLRMDRADGAVSHHVFSQLPQLLQPGDLLVVNNSRVLPARLLGVKQGGGAACELLLLRCRGQDVWECLAKPGKRLKTGARVVFGDGVLTGEILSTTEQGNKYVAFTHPGRGFFEALEQVGRLPLPHYIEAELRDESDYQTVYAKELGSAAAPTAGLHFTGPLLDRLQGMGVRRAELTLHVGLGTFRPVKEEEITRHHMHTEWYSVSEETAALIRETKAAGHRVIAVGTTSCRTLESVWRDHGQVVSCQGETDIFIYPGFRFGVVDGLITNFHLPESTLIMLVCAFAGYENTMRAYRLAVEQGYRFYSFGDAMMIL